MPQRKCLPELPGGREAARLAWDDIDWPNDEMLVTAPKTDSQRLVPIVPELYKILREAAPTGQAHIVTLSRGNLHRGFKAVLKAAKIPVWDDLFPTLRRSAETSFARDNPQKDVSVWLGHSMRCGPEMIARSASGRIRDPTLSSRGALRGCTSAGNPSWQAEQRSSLNNSRPATVELASLAWNRSTPGTMGCWSSAGTAGETQTTTALTISAW